MKKRMDNKGFSLVELIIVIAIMAILIGIVGSQVIPYIEKSRISKDKDVVDTCYTALQAAVAKEGVKDIDGATLADIDSKSGITGLSDEIKASIGNGISDDTKLKEKFGSNAYKNGSVKFWFDSATGFIAVSVDGDKTNKKAQALIISSLETKELKVGEVPAKLADVEKKCGGGSSSSSSDD